MKWIILAIVLLINTCEHKKASMSRIQFVDVTAELYLAEVLATKQDTTMGMRKDFFKTYQKEIFQKHHIDSAKYYSSYEFYNKNIDTMQVLMNDVINKLSAMQAVGLK